MRRALKPFIDRLGIDRSSAAVRLLRRAGLFGPLLVAYNSFSPDVAQSWRDCRAFHTKYSPVLNGVAPPGGGPTVLVVQLQPWIVLAFIEGMLTKALQLRGCRPVFVTKRLNYWAEDIWRTFGYRDFLYVEDYMPARAEVESLAGRMLAEAPTPQALLEVRFRDADVGRHALSTALAGLKRATLEFGDPDAAATVRDCLILSMRTVIAAERILDAVRPEKLMVLEKGYSQGAEFFDVSLRRGVDTLHWFPAHRDQHLLFRRYSYEDRAEHYFTLAEETWDRIKSRPWTSAQGEAIKEHLKTGYVSGIWQKRKNMLVGKREKTPDELRTELGIDPAKRTAFVFSHVLWDATFWFGQNLFPDYGTWLVETIRAACGNPRVNWVIKMHPDNVWKAESIGHPYDLATLDEYALIRRHFPGLPPHVVLMPPENDTNPVSLFGFADYAVTVRGTVGLEFPCFGTPTLTAGTGRYAGRGFTIDSRTPDEYLDRLAHIHEIAPLDEKTVALAQRFTHAVFNQRPLPITSFTWTKAPVEGFAEHYDLAVNVAGPAGVRDASDLSRFAEWALGSARRDFMLE